MYKINAKKRREQKIADDRVFHLIKLLECYTKDEQGYYTIPVKVIIEELDFINLTLLDVWLFDQRELDTFREDDKVIIIKDPKEADEY